MTRHLNNLGGGSVPRGIGLLEYSARRRSERTSFVRKRGITPLVRPTLQRFEEAKKRELLHWRPSPRGNVSWHFVSMKASLEGGLPLEIETCVLTFSDRNARWKSMRHKRLSAKPLSAMAARGDNPNVTRA